MKSEWIIDLNVNVKQNRKKLQGKIFVTTGGIMKCNEEDFGDGKYSHDLDCSDSFVGIFICQNV